jgi:hypothetical protein
MEHGRLPLVGEMTRVAPNRLFEAIPHPTRHSPYTTQHLLFWIDWWMCTSSATIHRIPSYMNRHLGRNTRIGVPSFPNQAFKSFSTWFSQLGTGFLLQSKNMRKRHIILQHARCLPCNYSRLVLSEQFKRCYSWYEYVGGHMIQGLLT